jgi:Cu/Ag efflux protein CusF
MLLLAGLGAVAFGLQAGQGWPPYETEGTVLAILADQGLLVIDHEPIQAPGFFMGRMEMPFSVADPALLNGVRVGDRIHFRVSAEKKSRIVELRPLPR